MAQVERDKRSAFRSLFIYISFLFIFHFYAISIFQVLHIFLISRAGRLVGPDVSFLEGASRFGPHGWMFRVRFPQAAF